MLLDFEVQRCTRKCAATDRLLEPGDVCYSTLEHVGVDVVRKDYCVGGWRGAPELAFSWWKSRVPEPTAKRIKLAPNDVLLELFDHLADRPDQQDLRYVLTLLLIRRRVLRLEETSDGTHKLMQVYCPKREQSYEVLAHMPSGDRIDAIQEQLSQLLIADAE